MKKSSLGVALLTIALLGLPLISTALGAGTRIKVGPNFPVTSDPRNQPQVEPSVAIDPRNTKIVVAGANDMRLFEGSFLPSGWAGVYRSTDGGKTWTNRLVPGFPGDTSPEGLASPLRGFGFFFDAVVAFDSMGSLFYAGIVLNTAPGVIVKDGTLFLAKYVNDGADLNSIVIVRQGSGQTPFIDKPWLFIDPANDNIYLTWTEFVGFAETRMMFSRSTNHGETFSTPLMVSSMSLTTQQGSEHAGQFSFITAVNNIVYVSWIESAFGPFTSNQIHRLLLVKSTDGGSGFSAPMEIARTTPVPGLVTGGLYRVHSYAAIATDETGTRLFAAWADFATGDSDILSTFSNDGGVSWSQPRRVNDVTANQQFYPFAAFSDGRLHIAWYDSRLDPNGKLLDLFYTTSSDFGQSFAPNVRVTSQSFDPNLLVYLNLTAAFTGDYIFLDAKGRTVQIVWSDNRNVIPAAGFDTGTRNSDIFTARLTVS